MKRNPKQQPPPDPDVSDGKISRRMETGIQRFLATPPQPHGLKRGQNDFIHLDNERNQESP
jgi:hypothetical protein